MDIRQQAIKEYSVDGMTYHDRKKLDKNRNFQMDEMRKLMSSPDAMNEWMENKRKEFDALPEEL